MTTSPHLATIMRGFAVRSLTLAVNCWPASSRQWGQAVLAEMEEISEPGEACRWAAGGMLLFLRAAIARLFEWMRLPVGARYSGLAADGNGPQFPKHSRLVTAGILLATAVLFFVPAGRQTMRTIWASWSDFRASAGDVRQLEKLAVYAEQNGDADEIAFAALCHPDPDRATRLANRAVAMDPRLTWIYASRFRRPDDQLTDEGWLASLRKFDPENAFIYLTAAETEGDRQLESARGQNQVEALTSDKKWMDDMARAFHAPRYDSYVGRHRRLTREGWQKAPSLSPSLVVYSLWSHRIPELFQIKAYANLQIKLALQQGQASQTNLAEETLGEVTNFGERMTQSGETDIEKLTGLTVTRLGLQGLEKLNISAGRNNDAGKVNSRLERLEKVEATRARLRSALPMPPQDTLNAYERNARWVQASAISALSLAVLTLLSLFVLEVGSGFWWFTSGWKRRLVCAAADYAPLLFLAASAVLLVSFRPFASVLEQYRAGNPLATESASFIWPLVMLNRVGPLSYLPGPPGEYAAWFALTIALSFIAVVVIVRGGLRRQAAPTRK